jgi:galactose mutarotase-like enzyme
MIILENEKLRVAINDGRGARVEEFFDKMKNKNWVWKPRIPIANGNASLGLEASFDPNWDGGWEEVFPNDAPVELENYKLVDHGEVWRRTWQEDGGSTNQNVSFYFQCETYPVLIRKSFVLHETQGCVDITYEIESRSSKPLPYIFKWHPALSIEPGDSFDLPQSNVEPVAPGFGNILPSGNLDWALPEDGQMREFVRLSDFEVGSFSVRNARTDSNLQIEFSKSDFPYLWLFQSYGGFMGHYVSMMEPTNAGHYDLKLASEEGKCGILEPQEIKTFSLRVKVS